MNKSELFNAFMRGAPMRVYGTTYGRTGDYIDFAVINNIAREDGSNLSYEVRGITKDGKDKTIYVRVTEDNPWLEVEGYPVDDWARECRDCDTRLGYSAWVRQQRKEREELEQELT